MNRKSNDESREGRVRECLLWRGPEIAFDETARRLRLPRCGGFLETLKVGLTLVDHRDRRRLALHAIIHAMTLVCVSTATIMVGTIRLDRLSWLENMCWTTAKAGFGWRSAVTSP